MATNERISVKGSALELKHTNSSLDKKHDKDESKEVEIVPKLKNKYCTDLRSALTFWDNYCIVDAYFN